MGYRAITAVLLPRGETISTMGNLEIDRWNLYPAEWNPRWFTTGYESKLWSVSNAIRDFARIHNVPVIAISWGGDHESPFPMIVVYDRDGTGVDSDMGVSFLAVAEASMDALAGTVK